MSSWVLGVLLGTALLAAFDSSPASDLYSIDPRQLAQMWERERVSPSDPFSLGYEDLHRQLQLLVHGFPSIARLDKAGKSTEGRDISLLSLGSGPENILIWSQMHGDEPTATSALLDLAQCLGRHRQEPWAARILDKYTLRCIPMLNPDGAARKQRRNAQGIDINRDARMLQTPEGQLLKRIRDQYMPILGFNLHNQNSLTTVGDTGKVATIALLAVASDLRTERAADNQPTGDIPASAGTAHLARRITAVLYEALSQFVDGHISRYDENFNPRAFGDNLTLWGTPIVLLESGGNPAGQPADLGVKLNFVGLLAALDSMSSGRITNADPAVFDSLKMNSDVPIFDLMLRGAWICSGTGVPLFRGDVAIRHDLRGDAGEDAIIADVGDLGVFTAHETIDCTGLMLTPGLISWEPEKSFLPADAVDSAYLERGILTVLATMSWGELEKKRPAPEQWKALSRLVNWGFVIRGTPRKSDGQLLRLVEWLAAGGRAWIGDSERVPPEVESYSLPGLFGVPMIANKAAARFQIPAALTGDPATALARWTSEAARQFRLSRRGTISVGALADLVLWKTPSVEIPTELRECAPVRLIVNGHPVEIASPTPHGRFLGRQ